MLTDNDDEEQTLPIINGVVIKESKIVKSQLDEMSDYPTALQSYSPSLSAQPFSSYFSNFIFQFIEELKFSFITHKHTTNAFLIFQLLCGSLLSLTVLFQFQKRRTDLPLLKTDFVERITHYLYES